MTSARELIEERIQEASFNFRKAAKKAGATKIEKDIEGGGISWDAEFGGDKAAEKAANVLAKELKAKGWSWVKVNFMNGTWTVSGNKNG